MTPSRSALSRRITSGSYAPMACCCATPRRSGCEPTTSFSVSLKNGAPGSSSTVRSRHAGANISCVLRPSRIVLRLPDDPGDRVAHLRVEAELDGPGRRLEDAVEGDELVDCDGGHGVDPLWWLAVLSTNEVGSARQPRRETLRNLVRDPGPRAVPPRRATHRGPRAAAVPPRPPDLLDVVRHLTLLQADPTAAVAPSADLVLWSRLGSSYAPATSSRRSTTGCWSSCT